MKVLTLYDRIGGEATVSKLVETFYDIIEHEEAGRSLFLLHLRGHGIAHSRIEQFNFLSGFLGGPKLYVERHHHSDVKQFHAHVPIGPSDRDAWLTCMGMAIDRIGLTAEFKAQLLKHFTRVANTLVNKADDPS